MDCLCLCHYDCGICGQREALATLGQLTQRPDLMPLSIQITTAAFMAVTAAGGNGAAGGGAACVGQGGAASV